MVFPTIFNLSLNFATRCSWSVSNCFNRQYRTFPSLDAKNIINLILVLTIWWCPCVESLGLLEKDVCYDQRVHLTKPLDFALLHFLLQGQTCLLSLDFVLLHSSPLWWKEHLFLVLLLEGVGSLHRFSQLQFLQHQLLGHRLGLLWYWMICPGKKPRSFCHFWDCIQLLHFGLSCWLWGLLHFFKGFFPTVVDRMVIWIKFILSHPF